MRLKQAFFIITFFIITTLFSPATAQCSQNDNLDTSWKIFRLTTDDAAKTGLRSKMLAALILEPKNGWYTYSHTPGKMGQPTILSAKIEKYETSLQPIYMRGKLKDNPFAEGTKIETYSDPTPILLSIPETFPFTINAQLSLLMCSDTACQPFKTQLNYKVEQLDIDALPLASSQPWWESLTEASLTIAPKTPSPQRDIATRPSKQNNEQNQLEVFFASLEPQSFTPGLEVTGLTTAILFGLLAGFLLNFMPCVLPVISLKLSTLLSGAQQGSVTEQKHAFREHNIFFSIGILLYFGILSAVLGFTGMAWGQIFQKPSVVIILTGIIFALCLSLFGLFNLPIVDLKLDSKSSGPKTQAMFTGILATLLATPCSGPFLGGVLGWAMVQEHYVISVVFLSVGTGMALPYILMAIFPVLATYFPKPGAWTVWVERTAGFFLAGTCIYLISILPGNMLIATLIFMWCVSVGAWLWGLAALRDSKSVMYMMRAAALALCMSAGFWAISPPVDSAQWIEFEQNDFTARLGQETMLVEFTADWCPSCKVLEKTTLTPDNLNKWQKQYGITFIKVDMTRQNNTTDAFLRALGSSSIPLAAIFPKGDKINLPIVIRDLYTTGQMEEALKQAFGSK